MGKVFIYGPKDYAPEDVINTTSRSITWSKGLSPFFLSPVNINAYNVENVWQYSKVYQEHVDENNEPTLAYFEWRSKGFATRRAVRYPMSKGILPLYSLWKGVKYDYVSARKEIYFPVYGQAVIKTEAYKKLYEIYSSEGEVHLWDFDGYDYSHTTLKNVLNDPKRKMGHAFVLAALLKNDVTPLYV